ncbi:MAG: hypothetical protein QM655_12235 [Nocardioidaceae bacterium]
MTVRVLGEAKATDTKRTLGDLERLRRIRDEVRSRGADTTGTQLALFSRTGFDKNLVQEAADDSSVRLVTLEDMYQLLANP